MTWFNGYGLLFMAMILLPNIVFAAKCKDGFANVWQNRFVEVMEQIGRFSCFILMVVNIPGTWFGFWFRGALVAYIVTDAVLIGAYCLIWIVCFRRNGVFRALALSVLPSVLFLFSGVMIRSVPLLVAAALFAPCHILLSYKNAAEAVKNDAIPPYGASPTA